MADQPAPIIQEIHLRVISGAEADRALDRIEAGASDAADSLRDTADAAGQAGRAVNQAGQQAEGGGSGGEGPWKRFKRTVAETSEGIGKMSFVTQGFGFLLGAISGGALATFIGQLGSVIDSIAGPLGWATSLELVTEEMVKAKTGIDDLSSGIDDYARSLGLANEKSLTFLERAGALQAVLNGGSQNRAAAEAKAKQDYADIIKTRAALVMSPDSADLQSQLRFLEQDLALQEKLQKQFAIINGDRANDGSVDPRAVKPTAGKPKTGGGGGRRAATTPVGGTFFGLDRTAAGVASGLAAGPAFGPADDPVARQLAALSAQPATFDAATASINAYADAQARAFDIELAQQYLDVLNTGLDQFGQGIAASAANAVLFGESFTKGVNQAMKALAAQALAQSLFEGAAAVGSLAMGNIPAAIKHGEAAALYAGVAAFAALGAAATGGLRSSGGGAGAAGGAGGGSLARPAANQTQAPPQFTIVLSAGAVHDAVVFEADARSGQRSARRVSVERAA